MSQELLNIVFVIVAAIVVIVFLVVRRYWTDQLNMSEEEEAYDRRIASLNEGQANRRRDDEIVRLLRGDEQPIAGQRRSDDESS